MDLDRLISDTSQRLRGRGERMTAPRRAVLVFLAEHPDAAPRAELTAAVIGNDPGLTSEGVAHALATFEAMGVVTREGDGEAARFRLHPAACGGAGLPKQTLGVPLVTIFEQYGAGAEAIGQRVAAQLGVPYIGQAVSSETFEAAAERDAAEANFFERFLRSLTPMPTDADLTWDLASRTDHEIVTENTESLLELAGRGAVILGRNATKIFAREPKALHVKLTGPADARVAYAAAQAGIPLDQARKRQEREDRVRADLARRLYRWDPTQTQPFDLIVNTASFTADHAADIIVLAFKYAVEDFPRPQPPSAAPLEEPRPDAGHTQ